MGSHKTNYCFFSGIEVTSCEETDGGNLDGYYYRVNYNGKTKEFKLSPYDDWHDDNWLKENGKEFLELVDKSSQWDFFKTCRSLNEIKSFYAVLKNS